MKLKEIYKQQKPVISFEIFPPKGSPEELKTNVSTLMSELKILSKYNPAFISVTYGAGGSTRDRTFDLVLKIQRELGIMPMPHFTCVGSSRQEVLKHIQTIEKTDIKNILALRGDPPQGETDFVKPADGFGFANELVEFIKSNVNLGIAVAGYPEGHQQSQSLNDDIENLKKKVDAGADVILTQVFYDNNLFFDFTEKARNKGIDIPIIPGILPITGLSQIERIASMCACSLPKSLVEKLQKNESDKDAVREIGIEFSIKQCHDLLASNEVKGLHFYTLNKAYSTDKILKTLI